MHPSTLGRTHVSGAAVSMNQHPSNKRHPSSSTSLIQGPVEGSSQQPPLSDSSVPSNVWYYSPSGGPVNANETSGISSSSMIGPTSTFYNPEDTSLQRGHGHDQYQQWIQGYDPQQQQSQQSHHHYSQQMEYDPGYHGGTLHAPIPQINSSYAFTQPQYEPSDSLSQYDGSTTSTVIQSNVGQNRDNSSSYQGQSNDLYSQGYCETIALKQSAASTPELTPESANHSYSTPPNQGPQQSQSQQSRQQQVHRKAPRPPQFQQNHAHRFLAHPNSSENSRHTSSNPSSSHSSPLNPPSIVWSNEPGYSHPKPHGNADPGTQSSLRVTSANSGSSRPSTSQNTPVTKTSVNIQLNQKTSGNSGSSPRTSLPGSGPSFAPEKTGHKRKRVKKNEPAQWSGGGYGGGESDSDSEDDGSNQGMGGGISVGMGGLGVVGKGVGTKGSRLPGACTHCKKLKMKCDFPKHEDTCKRCKSGGHVCIVEGRRQRIAPNKREYLMAQIRQKDAIIESLLKQLHNPYTATPLSIASYRMATSPSDQNNKNILAWLDRLQSSVRDAGKKAGPQAFRDLRDFENVEDDSEGESDSRTQAQIYASAAAKDDGDDNSDEILRTETKLQSSLPEAHVPIGLIADLSLSNSKANRKKDKPKEGAALSEEDLNDDNVGVANETYFMPGPATDLGIRATLIEQHSPPEILVHGLVKPEDVDKLFEIFYERVNPFISLLDPVLHTPASTFGRCPFLFTVICAISSRYYSEKSEIYPIAMHFAKHSAANALIDGWKSVELCQAYILMSIYAVPARRWEEDRSWLYTGLAIRIATDLNLHHVPTTLPKTERQEREILNKTRVWMICFNLDRSTATQFGKPSTIKEDFIVRNAKDWYKKSQYNTTYDVHLCGYSALLQIVAKFHDEIFSDPSSPTGLNKKVDFRNVTLAHDARLSQYHEEWSKRFNDDSDPNDPSCAFRCTLLPFLVSYSRLVMFSFGFQQAYQRGFDQGDIIFFTTCLEAATAVVENMIDGLAPSGYMRYAPDGHFVFASFASAFLLKLLRPEFSSFLTKDQEINVFDLIGRLIQTLSSPKIAIDDRHTPKLYARFLAGLLSRHRRDGATIGRLQPLPPPPSSLSTNTNSPGQSSSAPTGPFASSTPDNGGQSQDFSQTTSCQVPMDTSMYMPEATFATNTNGANPLGSTFDWTYFSNGFSDEEMLATMQAIKNPTWWSNMMMPGFSWPEGSPSPPANNMAAPLYRQNVLDMNGNFGLFQTAQVMM
ncbi:hypothetical protein BYT27DRAFT_7194756 [Phlegmacium glaucopus]|nr:hypothetical protein BYT27DRAFT_7194756 [Phlegmacium glaucopus]